jgi:glycerophosphoryl diester phosphodiesterase
MTEVYAHRGSAAVARENTVEAFLAAAELGADGVELDVRRTTDGVLVLHHEAVVPGLEVRIETSRRADLPSWLPTLAEALDACAGAGLAVNVEIKSEVSDASHDPAERCATETAAHCAQRRETDRLVLSSFSVSALEAARREAPDARLAWLFEPRTPAGAGEPISLKALTDGLDGKGGLARLQVLRLEGVHPYFMLADAGVIEAAHARALAIRVWTVDDRATIMAMAKHGADAIITNDVATARAALRDLRGL